MKTFVFVTLFALIGLVQPVYVPGEDKSQVSVEFPFECEACEEFAKLVGELVEKELPKETVEKEAEKFCNLLSGSLKKFCQEHLLTAVDFIYDEIANNVSPKLVCELIDFC
ncbi:saposin-C-like [Diabrotica undecimpunctata]|uniref:saposin-C-like n=1 Tax=Diabrotica undecimpunctata TaxID=50387 RepID=UPI003B634659